MKCVTTCKVKLPQLRAPQRVLSSHASVVHASADADAAVLHVCVGHSVGCRAPGGQNEPCGGGDSSKMRIALNCCGEVLDNNPNLGLI